MTGHVLTNNLGGTNHHLQHGHSELLRSLNNFRGEHTTDQHSLSAREVQQALAKGLRHRRVRLD
jgi:hypothetical protein